MACTRPDEQEAVFHAKLTELFRQPITVSTMADLVDALRLLYYHQNGTLPPEKEPVSIPGARGRRRALISVVQE